jgi:hypothetical protein
MIWRGFAQAASIVRGCPPAHTLEKYWFAPAPAARLGLLRILAAGYCLFYIGSRYGMLVRVAGAPANLFAPVGVLSILSRPLSVGAFEGLLIATIALNVAFLTGWCFRVSGPLFAVLLLCLLTYRNSWSMIYHSDNLLVLHTIVLGLTPSANALSLDALARSRFRGGLLRCLSWPDDERDRVWRYGWPIRLISTVTALTYFLAGVAKLAGELGWSWASGAALREQVSHDAMRKELLGEGASPLAVWLYPHPGLFAVLAILTLAIELGAPLALCNRRVSRLWALLAFGMHWGIFLVMGIRFRYQLAAVAFASFFDLERVWRWFAARGLYLSAARLRVPEKPHTGGDRLTTPTS